jgi:hypothetical protein
MIYATDTLPNSSSLSLHPLNFVEQNAAERIPAEILIDIFTYIRPVYKRPRQNMIETDKSPYQIALARFAHLRLVSRFWNQTITPVIHSEAVIFTLPIEAFEKKPEISRPRSRAH